MPVPEQPYAIVIKVTAGIVPADYASPMTLR